jgi:predicted DNA binding CopG/RHH family protein
MNNPRKEKKRDSVMGVRFDSADKKRLKEKANKVGLDVSTYVRYIALKSIEE